MACEESSAFSLVLFPSCSTMCIWHSLGCLYITQRAEKIDFFFGFLIAECFLIKEKSYFSPSL